MTRAAARPGASAHLDALVRAGLDPNDVDDMGLTPLHVAVWEGVADNAAYLMTLAPDLSHKNGYGGDAMGTVIHGAEFCPARDTRDHIACAALLLEAGMAVDPSDLAGSGAEEMVAFLEDRLSG